MSTQPAQIPPTQESSTDDISAQILSLIPKAAPPPPGETGPESQSPGAGAQSPAAPEPGAAAPAGSGPAPAPAAPVPEDQREIGGFVYRFPSPIYEKHRKFVDDGTDPKEIPHALVRGRTKGCQCFDCKDKRGEVFVLASPGVRSGPIDPLLGDLLSEEFIGRGLNVPNRFMEMTAKLRKLPKEAQELWRVEAEEVALYGKYGKLLADHYLKLPDFQHKDLIVFLTWYSMQFGMRIAGMSMILKAVDGVPPKEGKP